MLHPAPDRAQVRRQLDSVLRTDAALDAFCLDHFSEVHRRFARGMERTDKVNLLLTVEEASAIVAKLHECASQRGTFMPRPRWGWIAIAAAFLALAGGGLYVAFSCGVERPPTGSPLTLLPAAGPSGAGARGASAPQGINSSNCILDSTGAELRNRAPSAAVRDLGAAVNSGNRIEGSPGAVISNEVGGP